MKLNAQLICINKIFVYLYITQQKQIIMSEHFKTEELKNEVVNSFKLMLTDLVSQNKMNMTEKNKVLVEYEFMNYCMSLEMTDIYMKTESERI